MFDRLIEYLFAVAAVEEAGPVELGQACPKRFGIDARAVVPVGDERVEAEQPYAHSFAGRIHPGSLQVVGVASRAHTGEQVSIVIVTPQYVASGSDRKSGIW